MQAHRLKRLVGRHRCAILSHSASSHGTNQRPLWRQQGGKLAKRILQRLAGRIAIEVIVLDVQYHCIVRAKMEEVPLILARLDKHDLTIARVPALAATARRRPVDERRIAAGGHEDFGGHRRSRRFAMRARDGQPAPAPHEQAEHFGVADDWNSQFGGAANFRIVVRYRAAAG